jgi:uncharacterized protein
MARTEEQIQKFNYLGAVDADGHILEDAKLWENYCEAKYKPLAIRIKEDEEGLEYLEIANKPSRVSRKGTFSNVAATREKGSFDPRRKYGQDVSLDAVDAKDRIQRLDREGLDAAIIYPSLELTWETECDDPDYAQAMCRAYNRWIVDWCAGSGGRLCQLPSVTRRSESRRPGVGTRGQSRM